MNYWRMAFRIGYRGTDMWPDCYERGIAAIGYPEDEEPIVEDCSKLTEDEYDEIWRRKRPRCGSARGSLRKLAYQMRKGDTIYVKRGPQIVGKGVIVAEYAYDPNILRGTKADWWPHFVRVDWEKDFPKFEPPLFSLEPKQTTVVKLEGKRLDAILKAESGVREEVKRIEVEEGERYKSEATFRARNRPLIEMKKANSDYCCEVCGMNFEKVYGDIGKGYIIAHHLNPIGSRESASKTTLDDIALVCANCHDMLHRVDPPMSITELRCKIKRRSERGKKE